MDWVCVLISCTVLFLLGLPHKAFAGMAPKGQVISLAVDLENLKAPACAAEGSLRCRLYLPAAYEGDKQRRYPVLYLLHCGDGESGDTRPESLFRVLDKLIARGAVPALIAVAPTVGRREEMDKTACAACGAAVMSDLIPYVDARYRTLQERSGRFIAGLSAGAFGALCCSLACPQMFEACVLLNPMGCAGLERAPSKSAGAGENACGEGQYTAFAPTRAGYAALLEAYAKQEARVRFYIFAADDSLNHSCGRKTQPNACHSDVNMQAADLYAELHRKNLFSLPLHQGEEIPGNEAQLRIMSGGYPENAWLEGFENGLRYLLGLQESPAFSPRKIALHAQNRGSLSSVMTLQTAQGSQLRYRVHTPYGFQENEDVRYPVLYLLHGSNGSESSWDDYYPVLDHLTQRGMIMPLIAVAPVTGNSYWVDSQAYGPTESAVLKALIPRIDRTYPTIAQRSGRALAGFSMGGFGAVYYALRHPELFTGAVLLSPFIQDSKAPPGSRAATGGAFAGADGKYDDSLWRRSNYPALLPAYLSRELPVSLYIDAGDDDWNHLRAGEDLPLDAWRCNMEYQAVLLYLALKRRGNPARLRVANGGHDHRVWIQGFIEGLQYIARQGFGR